MLWTGAPWGDSEMELLGSSLTATYARPKTSHFLPAISTMASSYRNTQPALAMNPSANLWRTNSYYRSSSAVSTPSSIQRDNLDLVRAQTVYYPSNRTALSTRYTPDDWYKSNMSNYRESESSRKSAERLRTDTLRMMQDKEQLTRLTQEKTSKNIGERLNDIVFWRAELTHEIDNMVTEIAALTEVKRRLERALAETQGPLQVKGGRNTWVCVCVCVCLLPWTNKSTDIRIVSCILGTFWGLSAFALKSSHWGQAFVRRTRINIDAYRVSVWSQRLWWTSFDVSSLVVATVSVWSFWKPSNATVLLLGRSPNQVNGRSLVEEHRSFVSARVSQLDLAGDLMTGTPCSAKIIWHVALRLLQATETGECSLSTALYMHRGRHLYLFYLFKCHNENVYLSSHNHLTWIQSWSLCQQVSQECLYHREKRISIDLVHDGVEKDLLKVTLKQECERVWLPIATLGNTFA